SIKNSFEKEDKIMLKKLIRSVSLGIIVIFGLKLVTFLFAVESEFQKEINRQKKISQQKGWTGKDVPSLIKELRERKDGTKERVITRLSRSKDVRAIEPLAEVMLNSTDKQERDYTASQLSGFNDKRIVPIFKKQVLENGEHKITGARVLMKLGDKEEKELALPILEKYAEEGHPEVLSYTEFTWPQEKGIVTGKRVYYNKHRAKKIIERLLNHKDEVIRARAVYYLYTDMNDKGIVNSKIEEILKSNNPRVKDIGKSILRQIGDEKSKKRLQELEYQELQKELKEVEQKRDKKER
ncbi:MAG: hypothetical protein AB1349_14255, partial [Elusimicrobiota bacterium]